MNFKAPGNHPIRRGKPPNGHFWSKCNSTTRMHLEAAYTMYASHTSKQKVKDKDGKMVERWVFKAHHRCDESREYCHQLFAMFAHFLGMSKSQVVHSFLSDNIDKLHDAWKRKTKQHDTPISAFLQEAQEAWEKAMDTMRDWQPSYKGMAIFMDSRYKAVNGMIRVRPEQARREYEANYRAANWRLHEHSNRKIEEAVAYAYHPDREKERQETARATQ